MSFKPQHILVPVALGFNDDAALADALVDAACDVAAAHDATVHLLFVHSPRLVALSVDAGLTTPAYYAAQADLQQQDREQAAAKLATLQKRCEQRGRRATTQIVDGIEGSGEAIAHVATQQKTDLIVLWSHGRRGLKRLFLGSVAERVAHLATVPVLILRAPAA